MKQIVCNIVTLVFIMFLAWVMLSYANVILHNMQIDYLYPVWNLFTYLQQKGNNI